MKQIIFTLAVALIAISGLQAQDVAARSGFQHQGVVRDASGRPLANTAVTLQIAISEDAKNGKALYVETHELTTDGQGHFTVVVGEGKTSKGEFASTPWSSGRLWMHVALQNKNPRRGGIVLSSAQLPVAPYAMHAITTAKISGDAASEATDTEKQQSIFWLTGGNSLTKPATHFLGTRDNQDLVFKTNNETRMTITKEGQVKYKAGAAVTGTSAQQGSYPMHIQGAMQGIHIKVNASRTKQNVFVNFLDATASWGRIRGMTYPEWLSDDAPDNYTSSTKYYNLKIAELSTAIAGLTAQAAGSAATGAGAAEAISITLDATALGAELAYVTSRYTTYVSQGALYQGVQYSSGAADFAEYVEREPGTRKFFAGEVVGIKNGRVSLTTEGADHVLAVSSLPIALGNLPRESEADRFEKVAFMGQVLIRVTGTVNIGDYILPTGNNDGFAVAVAPNNMRAADYGNIIGIAWSASNPQIPTPYQLINVAVGINAFELSRELVRLEKQVDAITDYLKGKNPDFNKQINDNQLVTSKNPENTPMSLEGRHAMMSIEEHAAILDGNREFVENVFRKAKEELLLIHPKAKDYPHVMALMDNPVPALKAIYRDPAGYMGALAAEAVKTVGK
jgi:hypothetical protein